MIANLQPEAPLERQFINVPFRKHALQQRRETTVSVTVTSLVEKMRQVLRGMSNVEDLHIVQYISPCRFPNFVRFVPIVEAAWGAFGHNLCSITLNITAQGCSYLLSPTLAFPRLEDLTINLKKFMQVMRRDETQCEPLIVPFVNNHYTTLRSLALLSDDFLDLSFFLKNFRRFMHLDYLVFSYVLNRGYTQFCDSFDLERALKTELETLPAITIRLNLDQTCQIEISKNDCYLHVKLPKTEQRRTTGGQNSYVLSKNRSYLRAPLPNYVVRGYKAYLYSDVRRVISNLTSWNNIRSLEASVLVLSDALTNLFAINLSSLDRLHLDFEEIGSERRGAPIGNRDLAEIFCEEISENHYPNWKLAHFTALTSNSDHYLREYKHAIAHAIPGLTTIIVDLVVQ